MMSTDQWKRVVLVTAFMAGLLWEGLPGMAVAAGYYNNGAYKGEELSNRALLGVESVDGRVLLQVGRPKPGLLARTFTMSYCGQEMAPTLSNLMSMVGKPIVGWSLATEMGMMVYHRLEFQCN